MKRREKPIAALLALCLAVCGLALADGAAEDPVGTWYMESGRVPLGETLGYSIAAGLEDRLNELTRLVEDGTVLELRADGTLTMLRHGELLSGTWSREEQTVHAGEETCSFRLEDGRLSLDIAGLSCAFVRNGVSLNGDTAQARGNDMRLVGRWQVIAIRTPDSETRPGTDAGSGPVALEFTADGRMIRTEGTEGDSPKVTAVPCRVLSENLLLISGRTAVLYQLSGDRLSLDLRSGVHACRRIAPETEALTGVWVLRGRETGAGFQPAAESARDGAVLEIREDGTLAMFYSGIRIDGAWSAAEGLVRLSDGGLYPFRYDGEDGIRLMLSDGIRTVFTRTEDSLEEVFAPAKALQERLVGRWRVTTIVSVRGGEQRGRASLEAQGYDETVEFTDDGVMTVVYYANGEAASTARYAWRVGTTRTLVLDGSHPNAFSLEDGLLGLMEGEEWHYFLPWNESGTDAAANAPVGLWELVSIAGTDGSDSVDSETMRRMGYRELLEITADGRSVLSQYRNGEPVGEPTVSRYEIISPGVMVLDGSYVERFTLEGDTLTIHESRDVLVFVRVTEDAAAGEDPRTDGEAVPASAEAPGDEAQTAEETVEAGRSAAGDEPFDALAALSGQWRLDSIAMNDGDTLASLELSLIGYDELVEFTKEGAFTIIRYEGGAVAQQETHAFEANGANFLTLDNGVMLPWGFDDGRLVLIRADGRYFYRPADEEAAPGELLSDDALMGLWRLVGMRISVGENTTELDREAIKDLGMDIRAEFTADGRWNNISLDADGNETDREEMTYAITAPGVLLADNSFRVTYTLEGSTLTLRYPDGMELTFERAETAAE